ncbi:MAG: DegQ family serine endoprotease [Deltaproteobacteria bacterium]|nr:DegQ family serine endoprotease [Deltaproteobacteria bacterium]
MFDKKRNVIMAVSFLVVGLIIGLGISSNFNFLTNGYTEEAKISNEAIDTLTKTNQAMAEVTAAVKPAVVNISSTKTVKTRAIPSPFFNDPFFREFFGDQFRQFEEPKTRKQQGLGSGVIVDKDGYVLTNNHVVKDAEEIKIKLSDKREFKGKVVGTDQKTDLAVIKIEANHLPVVTLGDSDKLRVGETVIAIGNPFGLNQTVTSGIVSATGRANVGIADYEDFIQTDAAINPGNSGGALVNVRGELVGINTAIFSTSGGYMGIGFAIPSNMARNVMDSLIKTGKVVRGWLGVSIQPVTAELAKQFGLKEEKGALVGEVMEDSPAEKAGLTGGDVIVEYDGREVVDVVGLRNMVAATPPDRKVSIKYLRDGKPYIASVVVGELPAQLQKVSAARDNALEGVQVQDISSELRRSLGIPKRIGGVLVADVDEESPALGVLMKGDVIMEVDRHKISNLREYEKIVSGIPSDESVLIRVYRNGTAFYVALSPE